MNPNRPVYIENDRTLAADAWLARDGSLVPLIRRFDPRDIQTFAGSRSVTETDALARTVTGPDAAKIAATVAAVAKASRGLPSAQTRRTIGLLLNVGARVAEVNEAIAARRRAEANAHILEEIAERHKIDTPSETEEEA